MANIQFYLMSLIIAVCFIMVISEPLPEGGAKSEPENEPVKPEAEANAEAENSVSQTQAHVLTSFASCIAFFLLR